MVNDECQPELSLQTVAFEQNLELPLGFPIPTHSSQTPGV